MTPPLEVQNMRITQSSNITPAGQTVRQVHVQFNLGPHGPFTLDYTPEQFTAAAVNQKISDLRSQIEQIR